MGVASPAGFVAAGAHCGIKENGAGDLALVATVDGAAVPAAAVFTSNLATAAPVQVSRRHLQATGGRASAVVLNSGNANAATGEQGLADAERMCELTAAALGCETESVLVCSTGLIGIPLPMAVIEAGVGPLAASRCAAGETDAAEAIRTTDTVRKEVVVQADGFTVGGMAKGAAMLAPNMATMLAVLTTDAAVEPAELGAALLDAVGDSFNSLSVDGCTSTNDTVIVLASGAAGPVAGDAFSAALAEACLDLASQMAHDAEGATKVALVKVTGARSDAEAGQAARKVAESQLVKCSLFGADPYWGRIVSELGSAGVAFDPDLVSVAYGATTVAAKGVAVAHDADAVRTHLDQRTIEIVADLGLGDGAASIITNDLTPAYIDENMRTS
ncbi:MAG TPA: bifunctional glutamate N-acetyltransferase/amino-acid acetyltransferase ArgJ [Acidimicrobiales bacterium]|nr:bifunctional glutamate N-acetyltransferase/amino-acid acetyltransferase ArgJ [Acidimicrobiales bacterium]